MGALIGCLDGRADPARLTFTRPSGGHTLWAQVHCGRCPDESALLAHAAAEKVSLLPGSSFFATRPRGLFLRLSISRVRTHEIDAGFRRIVRAVEKTLPR
jgi:DNA-binding transcriptional MocR family regulator